MNTCSVANCKKDSSIRGLCKTHYNRMRASGELPMLSKKHANAEEREEYNNRRKDDKRRERGIADRGGIPIELPADRNLTPEERAERSQLYRSLRPKDPNAKCRDVRHSMYRNSLARAKRKGLPHTIDMEDIVVPEVCPALGIPLYKGKGVYTDNSPTLDKIIPELGYVPGNVWVISMRANRIKDNSNLGELELLVDSLRKALTDRNNL